MSSTLFGVGGRDSDGGYVPFLNGYSTHQDSLEGLYVFFCCCCLYFYLILPPEKSHSIQKLQNLRGNILQLAYLKINIRCSKDDFYGG